MKKTLLFITCLMLGLHTSRAQQAGNALAFDGVASYVQFTDDTWNLTTPDFTLECWIQPNSTSSQLLFYHGWCGWYCPSWVLSIGPEQTCYHAGVPSDGKIHFIAYGKSSGLTAEVVQTDNIAIGAWTHVAVTSNGDSIMLYINGNLEASTLFNDTIALSGSNNCFAGNDMGCGYPGRYQFNGNMDEVSVWNVARPACDIRSDVNKYLAGTESGLLAYYNFNIGLADSNNAGVTTLPDITGNGNDGTLVDFTLNGSTSNWVVSLANVYNTGDQTLSNISFSDLATDSVYLTTGITSIGLYNATLRGICYSTSPCPDISNSNVSDSGSFGTGSYSFELKKLLYNTTYYARAYSIDSAGLSYGNEISFTTKKLLPPGNALDFDGNDDYVDLGSVSPAGNFSKGFTFEAWAKWNSFNSWSRLLDIANGPGYDNILIANDYITNDLNFTVFSGTTGSDIEVPNALTAGVWTHIAVTVDSNGLGYIYINGVEAASGSMFAPANVARSICYLGRSNWSQDSYFNGEMDEVRIWNVVRNACEIKLDMNQPLSGTENGLVAYYNFDQGIADSNNAGITTLPDLSANAYNGTLNNFTLDGNTSNWVSSQANVYGEGGQTLSALSFPVILVDSVSVTASITNINSGNATKRGVCYSTSPCPDISDSIRFQTGSFGIGAYTLELTNLLPDTTYYARDYSIDSLGLSYGNDTSFKTKKLLPPGNALNFDGVNDYVEIPNNSVLDFTSGITMECWINTTNYSEEYIATKSEGAYYFSVGVGGTGKAGFYISNISTGWLYSTSVVSDGNWHHIAATWDDITNVIKMYVDGTLEDSVAGSGTIGTNSNPLDIGTREGGSIFYGSIDEFRLWNIARSACDIRSYMNKTLTGSEPGLVAYYNFDQGIADGNNAGVTTLTDNSTNGNNGTLYNFALNGASSNWIASNAKLYNSGDQSLSSIGFSGLTDSTVNFTASITNIGPGNATTRGICYSKTSCVNITDSTVFETGSFGTGAYTLELTNLLPNTTYHARAYSIDSNGLSYGNDTSFTTKKLLTPGNALAFDGTDDYVDLGTVSPLGNFSTGFTFEGWAKWNSFNNWSRLMVLCIGAGNNEIFVSNVATTNTLALVTTPGSNNAELDLPNVLVTGEWTHIACTVDSTGMGKIYINGQERASGLINPPSDITRNICYLGKSNFGPDGYFNGQMDEVHIWNVVRSACDIRTDMNQTLKGTEPGLVACYNFDQGIAFRNNAGVTNLPDISSYSYNGTLNNFALNDSISNWVTSQVNVYGDGGQTLENISYSNVTDSSVNFTASITNIGSGNATTRGICYSATPCVNITDSTVFETGSFGTGNYSFELTKLQPNTTYYARAYSIDSAGLSYGNDTSFTTNKLLPPGNALDFDGIDDYVEVPYSAQLNPPQFTIEAWVMPNGGYGTYRSVMTSRDDSPLSGYVIYASASDTWEFWSGNGSSWSVCAGPSINYGEWTHLAATYDGTSLNFYVNGILVGHNTGYVTNTSRSLRIGAGTTEGPPNYFFDGRIDEVRIWNVARTACDIRSDMNISTTGTETGLVAYYNFDQGIAGGNNSGITTLKDITSNGNNGTLYNLALNGPTSNWVASQADVFGEGDQTLATISYSNVKDSSVNFTAAITNIGSDNATTRGICYSTMPCPIIMDSTVYETGSFSTGNYTLALADLMPDTVYYIRAYSIDSAGLSYGNDTTFRTLLVPPVATAATNFTPTGFYANWMASSEATYYKLDVATDTTFTNFIPGFNNLNVGNVTTYSVNGFTCGASYYYRLRAYNSNDSSANSNVISGKMPSNSTGDTTAISCDSLTWYGTTYYSTGSESTILTNAAGCDSTVTLHLTVNHSTTSSTTVAACNSYLWNGTTYTTSGDKTFNTTNSKGCDSTATLHLTINSSTTSSTTVAACNSYLWNGTTYTTSGDKTFNTTNSKGCDSTATLHLTINSSTTSSTTVAACDSYLWNGTTYTTSGDKTYSTTNSKGCDSTATLHLTINSSSTSSTSLAACNSYLWNGTTYTTSGDKTYNTTNSKGCDSTATLHLTINSSSTSSTTISACDSYLWNGTTYTTSGDKTYSTTNSKGCDSTATLHLTINSSSTSSTSLAACNSYLWNGTTYTTSGDKTYNTTNSIGCDSTATLHLTINSSSTSSTTISACDSYLWNGTTYTTSGNKTYSTTNSKGCDSTATLHLTITTVDTSVTITANTLTANATGATYHWVDCSTDYSLITGATNQSYTATADGFYAVIVTEGSCSDTSSCYQMVITGVGHNTFGSSFTVYPNPTNGDITLDMGADYNNATIRISNVLGQVVFNTKTNITKTVNLSIDGDAGIYFVDIITPDGKTATIKVVKN